MNTTAAPASEYDVAICGAGPVGAALALLLAETWIDPARILLIDARQPDEGAADARTIAISQGSRTLLERIGAWNEPSATPIHRIHVSHRGVHGGLFGRTLIDRDDLDVPALGYVVRYGDLARQLQQALARHAFSWRRPARVSRTKHLAGNGGNVDGVHVELEDGAHLTARYAVHAEGGLFSTQEQRPRHRDYRQTAITSFVTCARPQFNTAWERFTPDGPIALLPSRQGNLNGYALVWCCKPDDARHRMALGETAFLDELHAQFGDRLGHFLSAGPRHDFVLGLNAVRMQAEGHEFAIGNAAQTLHPVAGQGLNLGLRDAFTLAGILTHHFDDAHACVTALRAQRCIDRTVTIGLTDFLPRVFASTFPPVAAGRGLALTLLDLAPPVRHVLARQMMDGQRGGD